MTDSKRARTLPGSGRFHVLSLLLPALLALGCDGGSAKDRDGAPAFAPIRPLGHLSWSLRGRLPDPKRLTWRFDPGPGDPVDAETMQAAIRSAAELWQRTGLAAFTAAAPGATPSFAVSFHEAAQRDCGPFLDWEGSVAHSGPMVEGTFIHLDARAKWSAQGEVGIGLRQTLLHEIGHVLGLDHSADPATIMFPGYHRERAALAESDLAALETLYGTPLPRPGDLTIAFSRGPLTRIAGWAPAGITDWAVLDVDGDRRADIVTWPIEAAATQTFMSLHFDKDGRVTHTRGPFLLTADPRRGAYFGGTRGGEGVFIAVFPDGRYQARLFETDGLPVVPWPDGRPLDLDIGLVDQDGDGRLETARPVRRADRGDIDGDELADQVTAPALPPPAEAK